MWQQVAREPALARRTELAAHGAPHLAGDTHCEPAAACKRQMGVHARERDGPSGRDIHVSMVGEMTGITAAARTNDYAHDEVDTGGKHAESWRHVRSLDAVQWVARCPHPQPHPCRHSLSRQSPRGCPGCPCWQGRCPRGCQPSQPPARQQAAAGTCACRTANPPAQAILL